MEGGRGDALAARRGGHGATGWRDTLFPIVHGDRLVGDLPSQAISIEGSIPTQPTGSDPSPRRQRGRWQRRQFSITPLWARWTASTTTAASTADDTGGQTL